MTHFSNRLLLALVPAVVSIVVHGCSPNEEEPQEGPDGPSQSSGGASGSANFPGGDAGDHAGGAHAGDPDTEMGGMGGCGTANAAGRGGAQCEPESLCRPGTYLASLEPVVCEACPEGTFSSQPDSVACTPWSEVECAWDEVEVRTRTTDTTCRSRIFQACIGKGLDSIESKVGAVALDRDENLYVCGWTQADLTAQAAANERMFVRKYGPAGDVLWTKQLEGDCRAVATDSGGFVYLGGESEGQSTGKDGLLVKLTSAGQVVWRRTIETEGADQVFQVQAGGGDAIYVTGRTESALFSEKTGEGLFDTFAAKYSPEGEQLWGLQVPSLVLTAALGPDQSLVLSNGGLRKLSTTDGSEIWMKPDLPANSAAVSADNRIFVTSGDPTAVRLTAYTAEGESLWQRELLSDGSTDFRGSNVQVVGNQFVVWHAWEYEDWEDGTLVDENIYFFSPDGDLLNAVVAPAGYDDAAVTDGVFAIGYDNESSEDWDPWDPVVEYDACVRKTVFQSPAELPEHLFY